MNKKCIKCTKTKSIIYFGDHAANDDGRQIWCKDCMSKYQKAKYMEIAEDKKASATSRRDSRARLLLKIKARNPCRCGEDEPLVLSLYSIVPGTPKFSTSSGITKARAALSGSAVVCSNCRIKIDAGLLDAPAEPLVWDPSSLEPAAPKARKEKEPPRRPALPPGVQ